MLLSAAPGDGDSENVSAAFLVFYCSGFGVVKCTSNGLLLDVFTATMVAGAGSTTDPSCSARSKVQAALSYGLSASPTTSFCLCFGYGLTVI